MKPKPQPQVYLGRSLGATEVQIPAITNSVVSLAPTTGAADTGELAASGIEPSMLVRVAATEDCYIRFDTSAVPATSADTLMVRGVEAMLIPFYVTHVSAIAIDNNGEVTVTLYQ